MRQGPDLLQSLIKYFQAQLRLVSANNTLLFWLVAMGVKPEQEKIIIYAVLTSSWPKKHMDLIVPHGFSERLCIIVEVLLVFTSFYKLLLPLLTIYQF